MVPWGLRGEGRFESSPGGKERAFVPAVEGEGCGEMRLNPDFLDLPWSDHRCLARNTVMSSS